MTKQKKIMDFTKQTFASFPTGEKPARKPPWKKENKDALIKLRTAG